MPADLLEKVRTACGRVARQAALVGIDERRLSAYAASLPADELLMPKMDPRCHFLGHGDETTAFFMVLDSVNFGSGYFPHLDKSPGRSGYFTVAAALHDHFQQHGPFSASELSRLGVEECARIFGQSPENPEAMRLMTLFARALNDLGVFLQERFGGDFTGPVRAAQGSAARLTALMARMPFFQDVADYRGLEVPFYKRAQITVADLHIAFAGTGPGRFADIDRLTIFADNLVPHVLRTDGILHYRQELAARIDRGEELAAGSREEVEIRACAVHAAELLVSELRRTGRQVNALLLDNFLWHRGQQPRYRERPRHRTRTVFY